jgi:hypothetical protein
VNIFFHYPPELLSLLIEILPRLCKMKPDPLAFFQGAGVGQRSYCLLTKLYSGQIETHLKSIRIHYSRFHFEKCQELFPIPLSRAGKMVELMLSKTDR